MTTQKMTYPHLSTFLLLITLVIVSNCKNEAPKATEKAIVEEKKEKRELIPDTIAAAPPPKVIDYDTTQWSDIADIDASIQIDMKYATTDNFVEEQLYECGRCLLRPDAAKALAQAQKELIGKGYGIKVYDCYRPRPIQQRLWDKVPNPTYVTNPAKGSMHNRGLAVDLTLVDFGGKEYDMGTPFDFFGKRAHTNYTDLPEEILERRKLLRETLRQFGFKHISSEWWHYYYQKSRNELSDYLWECE